MDPATEAQLAELFATMNESINTIASSLELLLARIEALEARKWVVVPSEN